MIDIKVLTCQKSQLGFWHCSIPEKTWIEGFRGELSAYSQMHRGRCLCAVLSELLLSNTKGIKKKKKKKSVILIFIVFLWVSVPIVASDYYYYDQEFWTVYLCCLKIFLTCFYGLPAKRKWTTCLQVVEGDRAVIVCPRTPGECCCCVCNFLHYYNPWGTRRT